MAAVPMALGALSTPVGAVTAVNVATAGELKTAWADNDVTTITLTADIELSDASTTCDWDNPFRSGGTGITVDGQGLFGITSSCEFGRLLIDDGTELVTLTGLTHFDGGTTCGAGGGLATNGPVAVVDVSASGNAALGENCPLADGSAAGDVEAAAPNPNPYGGAIYSGSGNLTITGSTFSGNHADVAGGAVAALSGDVVVTSSTFTENTAGVSGDPADDADDFTGGAVYTDGSATVSASTFTGNHFGDEGGLCERCTAEGGAVWAASGAFTDTSTFQDNRAECDDRCFGAGGAIYVSGGPWESEGDTLQSDRAICTGNCSVEGGAVSAPTVDVLGSSFIENSVYCGGSCGNLGGAIRSGDTAVEGSLFDDNSAICEDFCDSQGGAIASGTLAQVGVGSAAPDAPVRTTEAAPGSTVVVRASTFTGNSATITGTEGSCDCEGGAVFATTNIEITVDASTFESNVSLYNGAALAVDVVGSGAATIRNSTFTANDSGFGGALDLSAVGLVSELAYNTIVGNVVHESPATTSTDEGARAAFVTPPANLAVSDATLFANIIALPGNETPNCVVFDSLTSEGYNWADDGSCDLDDPTDDVAIPNNPVLGALGDNGGPTPTMLPTIGVSPVIDAIPPSACQTGVAAGIAEDQRGVSRPQALGCDIGAVEVKAGSVQVTKDVTGLGGATTLPFAGPYVFDVECSDGTSATLEVADPFGGTSAPLEGIVPGSTCTVVEESIVIVGIPVTVTYSPAGVDSAGITLDSEDTVNVGVTNDFAEILEVLGAIANLQPRFTG